MKITLFMAMSLNGIIATKDYKEDFLLDENWDSFVKLAKKYGNFIVGKKTYEVVKEWKDFNFDDLKNITKVVVSSDQNNKPDEGYIFAISPQEALKKLERLGFNDILITGGSTLNSSFAKLGLLDEIIININPVVVGEGISLFNPQEFQLDLKIIEEKNIMDKIIQVRYEVLK